MKRIFTITIFITFYYGCATVDKTLIPVDNSINKTKTLYKSTKYKLKESVNNLNNNVDVLKSNMYETKIINIFYSDSEILKNRDENFIKWSKKSNYNSYNIINNYIKNNNNIKFKELKTSDKMKILKDYFFNKYKKESIQKFQKKYPKITFDPFLKDRENIQKIYEYKSKLQMWEHNWNLNIAKTTKKVAENILSTLYKKAKVEFISYNPYEEELFLSILSEENNFKEKVKLENINKISAKLIKKDIRKVKPTVYFQFNDNKLELVGIKITFNKKDYLAKLTDSTYFREQSIKFSTEKLSLKDQDIQYTQIIKNITPPEWYLNIKDGRQIGYGQGKTENDAKSDAYKNIAQNKKVLVNSTFTSKKNISGSISTKDINSNLNIQTKDIAIKNSEVIKVEKKDGIWFIAIEY